MRYFLVIMGVILFTSIVAVAVQEPRLGIFYLPLAMVGIIPLLTD